MRSLAGSPLRRCTAAAAGAALLLGSTSIATAVDRPAARARTAVFAVHGNGNGHGHGMSQYGAQGAAIAGLSTARILAFYYPGTTLTAMRSSAIRVQLSHAAARTTVFGGIRGLAVTGYPALPTWRYPQFRLVPDGSGLAVAGRTGNTWKTLRRNLPARAFFSSSYGWVRMLNADGSSTRYHGVVGAQRSGTGEYTINRVSLDNYTKGVVPREMPSSWRSAAVGAQAVAARTFGRYAIENPRGAGYDICDTTSCQVYGGMAHYSSGGSLLWSEDAAAIAGNANKVLKYHGSTILAQFAASNGGATLNGGEPYLISKADPYDDSASGDPYLNWTHSASVAQVAGYYGLKSVTSISITRRSGSGEWGGWVLAATVYGKNSAGKAVQVATTGSSLASALGLMTSFFRLDSRTPLRSAATR